MFSYKVVVLFEKRNCISTSEIFLMYGFGRRITYGKTFESLVLVGVVVVARLN
jgi:hypothetical protein